MLVHVCQCVFVCIRVRLQPLATTQPQTSLNLYIITHTHKHNTTQSRYDRSRVQRLSKTLARALSPVATTHGMPTRFGLSGCTLLLGGIEMAASAMQFAAGALIMMYTVWKASALWEREAVEVVLAVACLRVIKEMLNIASPLIEMRRQPAQFDRNDDCVRQVCSLFSYFVWTRVRVDTGFVVLLVCVCVYVCVYGCLH